KNKKYDELDMGEYYNELLGMIESKTAIFCYGTSGSGKSVFIIKLANFFADRFNAKSLYCSYEEAFKKSMRDRSNNFNIEAKKLYVGVNIDFETLLEKIKRNYYRMIIIDSVQYMRFTYEQLQQLNAMFSKRKLIIVLVSFGTAYKKPACSNDIMHACDVKIFFDAGVATVDSRYLSATKKVRLFTPETKVAKTGSLF
ncbi:MAG: DNA repair protein RadA, partial [Carboxylicivirga sp.]|nr:DNA repair protein RadA [Carboxylicivirga sp.]